jgi:uncharacterized protein (DUF697 family)
MIDTEFLMQYSSIRSQLFGLMDEAAAQRGPIPMAYMLCLLKGHAIDMGMHTHLADYFIQEWTKLHPEAFNDSDS